MQDDTAPEVVIDNEVYSLRYHPRARIVHHELRSVVQGEHFRAILEKGVELFIAHGATKWLSDDRGNGPLTTEDADWARTVWSPRVIAAGWKYWAVVMPAKSLGQMDMTGWIKMYAKQGVTVSAFSEPERALKWLVIR